MPWTMLEDTLAPMMRWSADLTAAAPDPGPQCLALIATPMLQLEGEFGGASVEVRGSNSGTGWMLLTVLDHEDVLEIAPVYWLSVRVLDATPDTALVATLAGRR